MYDYLFAFETEDEAKTELAALGLYRPGTEDEPGVWDTSRVIAPISVTMLDGSKPSGYWIGATITDALPNAASAKAQAVLNPSLDVGLPASAYLVESVWPAEAVDGIAEISPLWAGRPYRFPGLPVVEAPVEDAPLGE